MNQKSITTKPHYQILDGLRGVAAIIVVTFHLTEPLGTGHLDILVNHGYLAVDFFFYFPVSSLAMLMTTAGLR
ncbi:hypothetical protein SAMN05192529_11275 [Arachidicoccus rhizosphaerae]|uniref:Acyltransferase family protein n=1 Tax=Arachidicoccus rhizosphaerae TaxID=551991 RepID=A0A1H3ZWZ9_9BACT|nr:hypothetical protein [Arachidicoccus rhizosphaerae]SEA27951.1 hypothetical protein SAMN05192529_11275 [Arachidicoccus rhizosphaerae]